MKGLATQSALTLAILAGCATPPDEIQTQDVAPFHYQKFDCDQVALELARINRKTTQLFEHLDKTASNDEAQMAVGLILFWPALFFLEGGDGPAAAEYARLKGEFDALKRTAIEKKCEMKPFQAAREREAKTLNQKKKQQKEFHESY